MKVEELDCTKLELAQKIVTYDVRYSEYDNSIWKVYEAIKNPKALAEMTRDYVNDLRHKLDIIEDFQTYTPRQRAEAEDAKNKIITILRLIREIGLNEGGIKMPKREQLIAVSGVLYVYEGIEETDLHKVCVVDIDEDGILTFTHNTWYLTDSELSNRGINLTTNQWIGLTKHFLRQNYNLSEEEIADAAKDIVCRCFAVTRVPLVEELPNYIAIYMDR